MAEMHPPPAACQGGRQSCNNKIIYQDIFTALADATNTCSALHAMSSGLSLLLFKIQNPIIFTPSFR